MWCERLRGLPHPHRPFRLLRWVDAGYTDTPAVVVELVSAPCPRCSDCDGAGGWITGDASGDVDSYECDRCARPWGALRCPGWLDRMLPGSWSMLRRARRVYDEPPF